MKKKNFKLELVKANSLLGLSIQQKKNSCIIELTSEIDKLGDLTNLMYDPSVILHLCNMVENLSQVKFNGVEKKQLVIDQIIRLFPILNNDTDRIKIMKTIDFLCTSDMVRKIATSDLTKSGVKTVCNFFFNQPK